MEKDERHGVRKGRESDRTIGAKGEGGEVRERLEEEVGRKKERAGGVEAGGEGWRRREKPVQTM